MTVLAANPIAGLEHIFSHPFLRYAFLAGTAIAVASGLVGYFLVLRAQVFTGDALSHVAFTGALGALIVGVSVLAGLYVSCVVAAAAMALLGQRSRADDSAIGSIFAWVLGLGALFLTVYSTSASGTDATTGAHVLFGSIFGLSASQALTDALVSLGVVVAVIALGRPLLFASVDSGVAESLGVPVRPLGVAFLGLVGITAAAATQALGALLLLGLVAAPAGAAQRLTARPYVGLWLSGGIAAGSMWAGLAIAYAAPRVPPSFSILAVATGTYLASSAATATRRFWSRSSHAPV